MLSLTLISKIEPDCEITIEGNFITSDTTGQVAFTTDFYARTKREVIITGPTAAGFTLTFNAIATAFEPTYPFDGKLGFTATLKVVSKPTLAISASNNITALTITTATLYPVFAAATYIYTGTSVGASVTVTATFAAGTATATNGTSTVALTSTVESAALALGLINTVTTITIVVTETGKIPKTYAIDIAKTA